MTNVIKLAKSMSIKWAEELPPVTNLLEDSEKVQNDLNQDPMMFEERITPPGGARQEYQSISDLLRQKLNACMNAIRSDYETLKNVPGALNKTPNDVLDSFFQVWNKIEALQKDDNIDINPAIIAISFLNFITDAYYTGIKTVLSNDPINLEKIASTMDSIVKESVSDFYEGAFVPKITFVEELLKASQDISKALHV